MGDLIGHIFPGTLFSICAVWWLIHMFQDYFLSRNKHNTPYRSRPWYTSKMCCNFPIEGAVKILVTTVGLIGETITTFKQTIPFTEMPNAQHMTMYFFFGVNGMMDILNHYKFSCLPEGIEVATGVLAFGVEAFLFYNHLHGRPIIDIQCHMFIFYAICFTIFCIFLEIKYREFVMPSLARAYFVLLQGTWFAQVGIILYPLSESRKWDLENHEQLMILALMFGWHAAIDFFVVILIAGCVWCCLKKRRGLVGVQYTRVKEKELSLNNVNGDITHVDSADEFLDDNNA